MSSTNNSPHCKTLQEIITEKRHDISELEELYKEQKRKDKPNRGVLNLEYLALKAKEEILKTSNPKEIPKCKSLLFAWAYQKLQSDVKELEELLYFQKNMELITVEKESELCKLSQVESSPLKSNPLSDFEEHKVSEILRSEILLCLHQKLIRRLRRICREYFPVVPENKKMTRSTVKAEKKNYLFSLLQKLFPDLKNDSVKSKEWEKKRVVKIQGSFPEVYVKLLLSCEVVNYYKKQKNLLTLKTR